MMHGRNALANADCDRTRAIKDDGLRVVIDAPSLEEFGQIRGMISEHCRLRVFRIGTAGIKFGIGIDEDQQVSAAQDKLVDRVLRLIGKLLRMHEHEHADVRIDALDAAGIEITHIEGLRELLLDRPGVTHLPGCRIKADAHRQTRYESDHGLLRCGQVMDQLGHVVFEEGFLVCLEERNH